MILYANPAAQFQSYQSDIEAAVLKVLRDNRYIVGQEAEALEDEFARFIGTKEAIDAVTARKDDALLLFKQPSST